VRALAAALATEQWSSEQLEDLRANVAGVLQVADPSDPANYTLTREEIQQRVLRSMAGGEQRRGTGGLSSSVNTSGAPEGVTNAPPPPPPPQPTQPSPIPSPGPSPTEQMSTGAAPGAAAASAPGPSQTALQPAFIPIHPATATAEAEMVRRARADVAARVGAPSDTYLAHIDWQVSYHEERQRAIEEHIRGATDRTLLGQLLEQQHRICMDVQTWRQRQYERVDTLNTAIEKGRQGADLPMRGQGEHLAATHSAVTAPLCTGA